MIWRSTTVRALPRWAIAPSNLSRPAQVERHRVFQRPLFGRNVERSGRVPVVLEPSEAPGAGLIGINREGFVVAATRMRDVVDAAAQRAAVPPVVDVEGQRRLHVDGGLQGRLQRPRLETHTRNIFAGAPGRDEWQTPAVAGDHVTLRVETLHLHLEPLDRGIDEARGAARDPLLAHHMPGLERVAKLELDPAAGDRAVVRKTEFALRLVPHRIEAVADVSQIGEYAQEILPHEVSEHEAVVQRGAPAHERPTLR